MAALGHKRTNSSGPNVALSALVPPIADIRRTIRSCNKECGKRIVMLTIQTIRRT